MSLRYGTAQYNIHLPEMNFRTPNIYVRKSIWVLYTIRYAESIYYDKKREWNKIVDRAMAVDFSWGASAKKYEELYNWLAGWFGKSARY